MSSKGFLKPSSFGEDVLSSQIFEETETATVDVATISASRCKHTPPTNQLPVHRHKLEFLYLVENNDVVLVHGETGSGKSTQLPQFLYENGYSNSSNQICVTEPRKIACMSLAQRVAQEQGSFLGREVGYTVRFDDCTTRPSGEQRSGVTQLKFVTNGILCQEMLSTPLLEHYSVIMIDEAHERSCEIDLILGLIKKILKKRKNSLKIIISSASMDDEKFSNFFRSKDCSVGYLNIKGRSFPLNIHHSIEPVPDYIKATVETCLNIHRNLPNGDILVFLTGADEIYECREKILNSLSEDVATTGKKRKYGGSSRELEVVPFFAAMANRTAIDDVFQRNRHSRRCILSTNLAEVSVTIPNIVYVVDCGFVKLNAVCPRTGVDQIVTMPISRSSADQRAGRAGRICPGHVYRLYTKGAYDELEPHTPPEMQRVDLTETLFRMKCLAVDNVIRFPFVSPPLASCALKALQSLHALRFIDDDARLTSEAESIADFPWADVRQMRMLLNAPMYGDHVALVTSIMALLQVKSIYVSTPDNRIAAERQKRIFSVSEGDVITALNVLQAFEQSQCSSSFCKLNFLNFKALTHVIQIRERLRDAAKRKLKLNAHPLSRSEAMVDDGSLVDQVCKCITSAFFERAAKLTHSGRYKLLKDALNEEDAVRQRRRAGLQDDDEMDALWIHPSSVLYTERQPEYVVFVELVTTGKRYMRHITPIRPEWLAEVAPHYYQSRRPGAGMTSTSADYL